MEENTDPEHGLMIEGTASPASQIDPRRARFPCCIVWTPLPVISWLVPFIGHVGICREDGVILDFAGPNFVCVDNFAFGAVTCYLQISKEKVCASFDFQTMNLDLSLVVYPTTLTVPCIPFHGHCTSFQNYQHFGWVLTMIICTKHAREDPSSSRFGAGSCISYKLIFLE